MKPAFVIMVTVCLHLTCSSSAQVRTARYFQSDRDREEGGRLFSMVEVYPSILHQSVCPTVHRSVHPYIDPPSIHPSMHHPFAYHPSIHPPNQPSSCPSSIYPLINLSTIHPSIHPSTHHLSDHHPSFHQCIIHPPNQPSSWPSSISHQIHYLPIIHPFIHLFTCLSTIHPHGTFRLWLWCKVSEFQTWLLTLMLWLWNPWL